MDFRSAFRSDIGVRLLDLTAHTFFAVTLPGSWWFQFAPDVFVPFLFLYSWRTNTLLSPKNPFVFTHELLHTLWIPLLLLVYGLLTPSMLLLFFSLQWAMHLLVDQFSHPRIFKKNLIWPMGETI